MSSGIDANILIYAGIVPRKDNATSPEAKELTVRAKLLLHELSGDTVFLPTVAISELLVPVPRHQHGQLIDLLQEMFICPEVNLRAAAMAADVWSRHRSLPRDLQYSDRKVLRADALIVASACAAGATVFYSHDKQCRALAALLSMKAHDLPTRGRDLFIEGDIRRGDA